MIKKIFNATGIKDFFKVRDGDGNFDWEQVLATFIQTLLFCFFLFFLWLIGVI